MAHNLNLLHNISTSTGTGNFTLTAVNGKQSFGTALSTADTGIGYFISNRGAAEWEYGTCHLATTSPVVLVRDAVTRNSTGGAAALDFTAGTKDVTFDYAAERQLYNSGLTTQSQLVVGVSSDGVNPISPASTSAGLATGAQYRAASTFDYALTPRNVWEGAGRTTLAAVTTAITVDMSTFLTLAHRDMQASETLSNPTNPKVGQHFNISVAATAAATLTLGTNYKLWTGVEAGPYSVSTTEKLYVCGWIESSTGAIVSAIGRTTAIT
jgi:hypothetical protein